MAFTYALATDAGKVRLLITDVDATEPLFQDDEIDAFLALEGGVRRAAALALETTASNEALVQKMTRLMDLSTNGPAVAKELRERATSLREQADRDDMVDGSAFDWAEQVTGPFGARERLANQWIREHA